MEHLPKKIHQNGISYTLVGDYYIPDLELPEESRPIGRWGRMHKAFLQEHRPGQYSALLLSGKLWTYISFFISRPQYFNFLFQQGNIQIDLNIGSGRESNYQPFAIYKEQVLKLLADTNMTQSKKADLIVALFAYVQGLTTLATMENVHYAYKWEDKLTDLIGIFSCEF